MTLPEVRRYFDHWKRYPPLRWFVAQCAGALGVKIPDPNEPPPKYMQAHELKAFVEATRGGETLGVGRR